MKRFSAALAGTALCALMCACAGTPAVSPVYAELTKNPIDHARLGKLARENPDARAPDGSSCLHYAIVAENIEAAETLAANGARLGREELYALFTPYRNNPTSRRFKFLSPIFPEKMVKQERFYACVAGDTAVRIAKKLGCTAEELRAVNPDVDFAKLKRGQRLRVPAKSR
ncbi:MAG: LysM peptidoglycan-binding domain-containing protein [Candidatus Spyradosoma sp.]